MNKNTIIMLCPDRLYKSSGGLGVQAKHTYDLLKDDYNFVFIGHPDEIAEKEIPNYFGVYNDFINIKDGYLSTILGQSTYMYYAFSALNKIGIDGNTKNVIIHAMDTTIYPFGVYLSKYLNAKLLVTLNLSYNILHSRDGNGNKKDTIGYTEFVYNEMENFGVVNSNAIIHVSKKYKEMYDNGFSYDLDNSFYVPNPINEISYKYISSEKDNGKIGYIGRFTQSKGVSNIITSIKNNLHFYEGIKKIDVVGSSYGSENNIYNEIKKAHDLNILNYVGSLYDDDKIKWMKSLGAMLIPSITEPFGIVALEALLCGAIPITTTADGLGDILNSDVAIIIGNDPDDIKYGIERYFALSDDRKLQMREAGLQLIKEKYTLDIFYNNMKNIYEKLFI